MAGVSRFSTQVRFENRVRDLGEPIDRLVEFDDLVVAIYKSKSADDSRNVVGFERDGTQRWRIDSVPDGMPDSDAGYLCHLDAWRVEDELWTRNWNQHYYRIDREDGSILDSFSTDQLAIAGRTIELPRQLERFVRLGDCTIVHLEWPTNQERTETDRRNVLAFDPDGTLRWQIEAIAIDDRHDELWDFDQHNPYKLPQGEYYESISVESGQLLATHNYGIDVTVDIGTGGIAIRGPAAVGDRLIFDDDRFVGVSDPIEKLHECERTVIVLLNHTREEATDPLRNIHGFSYDGTERWQISQAPEREGPYTDIRFLWGNVFVRTDAGTRYDLDPETGTLGERYAPNELPLPDGRQSFDHPISKAIQRNDTIVVHFDTTDDESIEDNQNIRAYNGNGDHRWTIEPRGDWYNSIGEMGDHLTTHTFGGQHLHVDWETGEVGRWTNRLW